MKNPIAHRTAGSFLEARTGGLADIAGLLSVYGFSASITVSTAGMHIFSSIALLAMLCFYKEAWELLKRSWLVRIVVVLTAYVALHSVFSLQQRPILAENGNPNWSHFLLIGGLPSLAVAFFMNRHPGHVAPALLIMIAVIAVGLGTEVDWFRVMTGEFTKRGLWEERSAGETSFLAATCIIVLLGLLNEKSNWQLCWRHWPFAIVGVVAIVYFSLVLLGSQTRGVWAGTAVALVYFGISLLRKRSWGKGAAFGVLAGALITLGVVGHFLDAERLWDRRVEPVLSDVHELLGHDLERWQAEGRTVSHRANRWSQGLTAWWEQPLLGWGGGARAFVGDEIVDMPAKDSGHFHNLYIEWLAGFGVIGLVLFFLLWVMILRGCSTKADKRSLMIVAWVIMAAITVFVSTRIGRTDGRAVIMFMMAVAMVLSLPSNKSSKSDAVGSRISGGKGFI